MGYGALHIGLQGLVPFEAGEGALAGSRVFTTLDDVYPRRRRAPRDETLPPQLPVLSGEELADLFASVGPYSSVTGLLDAARRAGVPEDLFLRSLGIPRQRLVALFEARGAELAEDPALLPTLLAAALATERAVDNRLRLALLLAVALLWDD
jgi:hypothetical protein